MNVYEKLIEVRKSCEFLKKDNKGYQFNFVSSSQTLGTLRGKMDEMGLLLVPEVTSSETRDHTTAKGKHEYFTILNMKFTWINAALPEEKVECPWIGHGLDDGEKGIGKALTYAEKYFLLKFFNIATDKDDPDSHQRKQLPKSQPAPPVKQRTPQEKLSDAMAWIDKTYGKCTEAEQFAQAEKDIKKLKGYSTEWIDYLHKIENVAMGLDPEGQPLDPVDEGII